MSKEEQNKSLLKRLYIYQKERFPFLGQGPLIAIFTFSAISYSRICRDEPGFISWTDYLIGIFVTIGLFFVLRLFDEAKDKEEDAKYRPYLPVPRGLVSLKELQALAWVIISLHILVILLLQTKMIFLYLLVLAYLLLMRVEFFVPDWLKDRRLVYVASHMVIIPMVDIYASGLDWLLDGDKMHWGLAWFFAVSYFNGIVLEFGRKINSPEDEEEGVETYSKIFGTRGGAWAYVIVMLVTMCLAIGASHFADYGWSSYLIFIFFFILCSIPALLFIQQPTTKKAKYIEYASAAWTALMYLALGGIPMAKSLIL